jgi:alkylation response protein AidB-like acyl-CoA dehydrogenase
LVQVIERAGERERAAPEQFPADTIRDLFDSRLISAPLPEALGGCDWSALEAAQAIAQLAAVAPSAALIAAMPLGLAGIYATGPEMAPEEHRAMWADQIAAVAADYRARRLYAACNSEAGAGGSLAATKTVARRDENGTWHVSGTKILASGGVHADVFFSTAKVSTEDLPGAGIVEFFRVPTTADGVSIADDWDGFGMRATESQTVSYDDAPATGLCGFPHFHEVVQPVSYWYCLFAAIPLGCATGILDLLSNPAPSSPAMRLRLADARMRHEALAAYLNETASQWRPAAGVEYAARVLRMKTYVTAEATKLCAELFALSGGRSYRRNGQAARLLADSFAGTALRPPLALALDTLVEQFGEAH